MLFSQIFILFFAFQVIKITQVIKANQAYLLASVICSISATISIAGAVAHPDKVSSQSPGPQDHLESNHETELFLSQEDKHSES